MLSVTTAMLKIDLRRIHVALTSHMKLTYTIRHQNETVYALTNRHFCVEPSDAGGLFSNTP